MARITIDSNDICGGSIEADVSFSDLIEDMSVDDAVKEMVDQYGTDDIVSELDAQEVLGTIEQSELIEHIVEHSSDVGGDIIDALFDDENMREYAIRAMASDPPRFIKDCSGISRVLNDVDWKLLLAASLSGQCGYSLKPIASDEPNAPAPDTVPEPGRAADEQAEKLLHVGQALNDRFREAELVLEKLSRLREEIGALKAIKESIYADPDKA